MSSVVHSMCEFQSLNCHFLTRPHWSWKCSLRAELPMPLPPELGWGGEVALQDLGCQLWELGVLVIPHHGLDTELCVSRHPEQSLGGKYTQPEGIFYLGLSPVRRTFSTGDGRMTHFWLIMRKTSSFFSSGAKNLPSVPLCGGKGIHSSRCGYTPAFVCSNVLTSLKKKKRKGKRLIFLWLISKKRI